VFDFAKHIMPLIITHKVEKDGTPERFAETVPELLGKSIEIALASEYTEFENSLRTAIQTAKFGGKVFVIGAGKDKMKIPFILVMQCKQG